MGFHYVTDYAIYSLQNVMVFVLLFYNNKKNMPYIKKILFKPNMRQFDG